jgi:hypothetical protein
MYTTEELYETICIPTVSTDYRLNGEMKKRNIRWFPAVMDMGAYWLKHRLLVDSKVCVYGVAIKALSVQNVFQPSFFGAFVSIFSKLVNSTTDQQHSPRRLNEQGSMCV